MKIVATSDTHYPFAAHKVPEGDIFLHAGDLMYSGYPDEWYPRLKSLEDLPHKNKIYVPGNHDFHLERYPGVASAELRKAGVFLLTDYRPTAVIKGIKFLGIPFVTGLQGWAFNRAEEWIEDWLKNVTEDFKPDIVISHAPPYRILDCVNPGDQHHYPICVGGMALNKWFYSDDNYRPKHWFCGHIHESYGEREIEGCTFHNVAMCDRAYNQVNKPAIIEWGEQ